MSKKQLLLITILTLLMCFALAGIAHAGTITIQRGDTLWGYSQQYGVTIDSIKQANGLTSNTIYAGQSLYIPNGPGTYNVKRGDTLWGIARMHNITLQQLRQANNLWTDLIHPGQVLTIPGQTSTTPPTSPSPTSNITQHDIDLMAKVVYAEARGEVYEGQVAVAAVILNRVKHPEFPKTIEGVIYEPWAFTSVNDGQIYLSPNDTAYRAVQDALNGYDPSLGAVFFWNPYLTDPNNWVWTRQQTTQIGNHVFAK